MGAVGVAGQSGRLPGNSLAWPLPRVYLYYNTPAAERVTSPHAGAAYSGSSPPNAARNASSVTWV